MARTHNIDKYRNCKRDLAYKLRVSKKYYFREKLMSSSNNMKEKWSVIRTMINKQKSNSNYCPIEGNVLGNHYASMADKLNRKLKNIKKLKSMGVSGFAMISEIFSSIDPEKQFKEFKKLAK